MDQTSAQVVKTVVALVVVWLVARILFSSEKSETKTPHKVAAKPAPAAVKEHAKVAPAAPAAAVAQPSQAPKVVAPKTAPAVAAPAPVEVPEKAPKAAKSKQDKKPKAAPAKAVTVAAPPAAAYDDSESDDEEVQVVSSSSSSSKPKVKDSDQASFGTSSGVEVFDGDWSVVEKSSGKTKKPVKDVSPKASAKSSGDISISPKLALPAYMMNAPAIVTKASQHANKHALAEQQEHKKEVADAAPVHVAVEKVVKTCTIDAKKVGALVGAKGVTLKAIQEATECEIKIAKPKEGEEATETVSVTVTGLVEKNVNLAVRSISEMGTKGYCLLLKGENFSEGSIMVQPSSLGEIVGKGGSTLRAIQDAFDVKINTPQNVDRASPVPIKLGVVGDKNAVKKAKEAIKQLTVWHHTDVTHPGCIHEEMDLDAAVHKYVIGNKGSEIHHIQNNFKVSVHIPNSNSSHTGVLVVGEQDGVTKACAYISKVVEKALAPREEKPSEYEKREQARELAEQEEVEPWMRSYIKGPSEAAMIDISEAAFPTL